MEKKMEAGTGTTERVLALLSCFGEAPEWQIGELALKLGLPKSTTHRLIGLCSESGYLEALGGGTYAVGAEFSRVAALVATQTPLVRLGTSLIEEIARECEEVSVLAVAVPEKLAMAYLAKAEPTAEFRYHVEMNVLQPLLWGACARSILAHLHENFVRQAISSGGHSPSGVPFDEVELRSDLDVIRAEGYCISRGQHKLTAVGVAVPFFGAENTARGALGVSIPSFRFKAKQIPPLIESMQKRAKRLSYALGSDRT